MANIDINFMQKKLNNIYFQHKFSKKGVKKNLFDFFFFATYVISIKKQFLTNAKFLFVGLYTSEQHNDEDIYWQHH